MLEAFVDACVKSMQPLSMIVFNGSGPPVWLDTSLFFRFPGATPIRSLNVVEFGLELEHLLLGQQVNPILCASRFFGLKKTCSLNHS